jgi:phosphoglycerate dehydrogenase-like enzyme
MMGRQLLRRAGIGIVRMSSAAVSKDYKVRSSKVWKTCACNSDSTACTPQVLFCGHEFEAGFLKTVEALAGEPGVTVSRCPREELSTAVAGAHMLVPFMGRVDAALLEKAPQLRYILQFGVGLEGVDLSAARAAGVRVANIPSAGTGNAASCAEMALFLALSLLRDTKGMASAFAQRRLGTPCGVMLAGRSALVIGAGSISRELVPRLQAMGVRVSGLRRGLWADGDAIFDTLAERGQTSDMHRMLGDVDLVFLACTLNETSRHLADAAFLSAMRPGAMLVNVARGGLVSYEAALEALRSGQLGGFGTDVCWSEPWDPEDELAQHPRALITPHVAGVTDVSYRAMARIVADEVRRHMREQMPSPAVTVFA